MPPPARGPGDSTHADAVASRPAALVVLTPDLLEVRHACEAYGFLHDLEGLTAGASSSIFSRRLPQPLVTHIVSNIAGNRPHSFTYTATGADGVARRMGARLVVPFGGGRPMVFGVAEIGTIGRRTGAIAYELFIDVLASFEGEVAPRAMLDVLLLLVAEAAAADAVALVRGDGAEAQLVAAVDAVPGEGDTAAVLLDAEPASFPVELAANADGLRLTARAPRRDRSYGWLGDAAFDVARALLEADGPAPASDAGGREPHRVVYVDDDAMSRDLLTEFFRLLPRLELVPVATVAEARAAVVAHRPAVVICDAWLGSESTESFVTELLTGSQLDAPAVVVLSADANASTIARFRRLGVSSYLAKPIDLDRLSTVVHELANSVATDEGNGSRARTTAPSGN